MSAPNELTLGPDQVEISDRFWEATSDFSPTAFSYTSLAEISADAHLVILGRVVGTREGEALPVEDPAGEQSARPLTFGVIAIDEVLKGVPNIREPGAVLVSRLGAKEQAVSDLPREQIVIFLKNYQRLGEEFGTGLFNDATDRFYYVRPNGYQAVLRNINGTVRIVNGPEGWEDALGPFPAPLDGEPFAEVLNAIKQDVGVE